MLTFSNQKPKPTHMQGLEYIHQYTGTASTSKVLCCAVRNTRERRK